MKNMEILNEFEKRISIYEEFLSELKRLNNFIQYFSNLKVGLHKKKMIAQCRDAIKQRNYKLLIKICATGHE